MKLINGKAKLDENEQIIVNHGWALEKAQSMNILVTKSYSKDSVLYLETSNGQNDIDKFMEIKEQAPYCHIRYNVNGTDIV
jgi:hypothetical protein